MLVMFYCYLLPVFLITLIVLFVQITVSKLQYGEKNVKIRHRFFDHFGSILVVGRVLLASVDTHLKDFGFHVIVHISLKIFEKTVNAL